MSGYPEWISVPFRAGDFWAKAPMTWLVSADNVATLAYWLAGRTLTLSFKIARSSLKGDVANELYLRIPGGYMPAKSMANTVWLGGRSLKETGYATVHPGLDAVVIFRQREGAYDLDAGTVCVFGQITFEVE